MPERFIVPSLNEVARTVGQSIKEADHWKIIKNSSKPTSGDTKRIASN